MINFFSKKKKTYNINEEFFPEFNKFLHRIGNDQTLPI